MTQEITARTAAGWEPTSDPSVDRKWTVMVFMGADTEAGNAPLIEAAEADVNEMKAVGSGGALNILVQVHDKGVPRRQHVGVADMKEVPIGERDVKGGRALMNFIKWSLTNPEVKHRPQDHSIL